MRMGMLSRTCSLRMTAPCFPGSPSCLSEERPKCAFFQFLLDVFKSPWPLKDDQVALKGHCSAPLYTSYPVPRTYLHPFCFSVPQLDHRSTYLSSISYTIFLMRTSQTHVRSYVVLEEDLWPHTPCSSCSATRSHRATIWRSTSQLAHTHKFYAYLEMWSPGTRWVWAKLNLHSIVLDCTYLPRQRTTITHAIEKAVHAKHL